MRSIEDIKQSVQLEMQRLDTALAKPGVDVAAQTSFTLGIVYANITAILEVLESHDRRLNQKH